MTRLCSCAPAAERFRAIWLGAYRYPAADPEHARFLLHVDESPYRARAHEAICQDDPLLVQAAAPDLAAELLALPLDVLYERGFAPAVRLAAAGIELEQAAAGCWRAITEPD